MLKIQIAVCGVAVSIALCGAAEPAWKLTYEKPGATNVITATDNATDIRVLLTGKDGQWSGKIVNDEPGATVLSFELLSEPQAIDPETNFFYIPWESGGARVKVWPKAGSGAFVQRVDQSGLLLAEEFDKAYNGKKNFWVERGDDVYQLEDRLRHPGGWATMQWMTVCDGKRGFYLGSHDPRYTSKNLIAYYDARVRTLRLGVRFNLWHHAGSEFVVTPVVMASYEGTWHLAARRYREWWNRSFRFAYVPNRVKDMTGVFIVLLKQQNGEIIWPYTEFESLGKCARSYGFEHVEFHAWGKGGHDQLYPEYDPDPEMGGREGLIAGVKKLHELGLHATLYSNGQLQEREVTKYWHEKGKGGAIQNRDGSEVTEFWHKFKSQPGHTFDVVCYWQQNWKDQMLKICRDARDYGFDGFFYDQIGVSRPRQCFNQSHGHRVGEWVYTNDRHQLFKGIADVIHAEDPEFVLASEGYNDAIFDSCAWYEGWSVGVAWQRFDKEHAFDYYPEMTFYTFPELVATDRSYTPSYDRRQMNGATVLNCRINFAVRYRIDRDFVERGILPRPDQNSDMLAPTDCSMMAKADWAGNRAYDKLISDWRRANKDLLLRGTFKADEGFSVWANGDFVANRWDSADGRTAILVWNGDLEREQTVKVSYPGEFVYAEEPEAGTVCADTAIPANTLRLYVYKTAR